MFSTLFTWMKSWIYTDESFLEIPLPKEYMELYENEIKVYQHYKISDYYPIILVVVDEQKIRKICWIKKWINHHNFLFLDGSMNYVCKFRPNSCLIKEGILYVNYLYFSSTSSS